MKRWLVRLAGEKFDLEEVPYWFPSGAVFGIRIEDSFYLTGTAFERLADAEAVRAAAIKVLDEFNGVIAVLDSSYDRARVDLVLREHEDGRRDGYMSVEGRAIGRGRARGTVTSSVPTANRSTQAQDLLRASKVDRHLQIAVALWADPVRSWPRLYRVLEELEEYLGQRVDKAGLTSLAERSRFTRTANTAEVSGSDSRHAIGKFQPPEHPMLLCNAATFVGELLRRCLSRALERVPSTNAV